MPLDYTRIEDYLKQHSIEDIAKKGISDFYNYDDGEQNLNNSRKLLEEVFVDVKKSYMLDRKRYNFVKALDEIFKDKLEPFPIDDGKETKTVYCQLVERDNENEKSGYFVFSALTDAMIKMDKAFFDSNRDSSMLIDFLYKPYLYQFVVEKLPKLQDDTEININKWYKVEIRKASKGEEGCQRDNRCVLCFAASPYVSEDFIYDSWVEATEEEIGEKLELNQREMKIANKKTIEESLKKVLNNVEKSYIRIFKFGQANFIRISNTIDNQKKNFLFDCGFPTKYCLKLAAEKEIDYENSKIFDNVSEIDSCDPDMIMISHWDEDHYRGAFMFNRDVYNKAKWIVPYYYAGSKNNYSADKLIKYLIIKEKVLFVGNDYDGCTIGNYKLARGTHFDYIKDSSGKIVKNKDVNNSGLILRTNKTILPGDCDCEYWPKYIKKASPNNIRYICVPHHASPTTNIEEIMPVIEEVIPNRENRSKAFICVGYNDYKKKHPSNKVIETYKDLGFEVYLTMDNASKTWFKD